MDPYHPFYSLIVAGGSGTRMDSSVPKQFLELAGKPMIVHTLQPFLEIAEIMEVVLVLPLPYLEEGKKITGEYFPRKKITIIAGGSTRTDSVRNGLERLPDDGIVAIHDGARPLVTRDIITRAFETAMEYGAAIPITHVRDTVRKMHGSESEVVDRDMLRLVQTPQAFSLRIIKDAYRRCGDRSYTDDASVITEAGYRFTFFEGSLLNMKVTTREDLELAEAILKDK